MASQTKVLVVHDFDEVLYTRRTCLRRAFWLVLYAFFGWSRWLRKQMPEWLFYEKYAQAKALAVLDKTLGVNSVFAFRWQIDRAFPTLRNELERLGAEVVNHWHLQNPRKGYNDWKSRGAWQHRQLADPRKHYMNYDRHYVAGEQVKPDACTVVCWHVDHMPYNLYHYLEFIEKMKKEKQI